MSGKRPKKDFPGPRHGGSDGYGDMDGYDGFGDQNNMMQYDLQDYSARQTKPTPETEVLPFYDVKYDNGPDKK